MKAEFINLPKILDQRGNLSFVEANEHFPFTIKRTYWIYDVPGGEVRGGHAFKENQELIIALSGSFDVVLHDGKEETRYHLNRSYYGLYVPKMFWRRMENFSTNSLAIVLSSIPYNADDYIRDFDEFKIHNAPSASNVTSSATTGGSRVSRGRTPLKNTVHDCHLIDLPKIQNPSGNITPLNNRVDLPFDIKRIYYLYDIPGGESRGGHAHRELEQYLIAASGSFDVLLYDGKEKRKVSLNRPYQALHIVPGIWRELNNFSSGSICLVLASHKYDEKDYMRNIDEFEKFKKV